MADQTFLCNEPLAQARARGDGVLRCTFTNGRDDRFLYPSSYSLGDGTKAREVREVPDGVHVVFPRPIGADEAVWM